MINSEQFWRIGQDLNGTVVDSGIRLGVSKWDILFTSELVSGDTLAFTLNGVSISQAFTTNFATTITALEAQITAVDEVASTIKGVVDLDKNGVKFVYKLTIVGKENVNLSASAFTVINSTVQKFNAQLYQSQSIQILPAVLTVDASQVEKLRVDVPVAGTTYEGFALPGTLNGTPAWKIKRVVVAGALTTTTFASGNSNFDKVWDDRATYTYS
jgi:hypothetical protein